MPSPEDRHDLVVRPRRPQRGSGADRPSPGATVRSGWQNMLKATPLRHSVDAVQYGVAVVLLLIAVVVLVRTAASFLTSQASYPQSLISAIDGVLIVIIVVDVLRTVLTHFEGSGFPLQPFLIIGIKMCIRDRAGGRPVAGRDEDVVARAKHRASGRPDCAFAAGGDEVLQR